MASTPVLLLEHPDGKAPSAPVEPLHAVEVQRIEAGRAQARSEELAAEVPVAMQFNGRPHAVMLATPRDLEDFAVGFAITERIVAAASELTLVQIRWTDHGVALEMLIPAERAAALSTRDRNLTGRTGCGLCGTATLEAAIRPVRHVSRNWPELGAAEIWDGMRRVAE